MWPVLEALVVFSLVEPLALTFDRRKKGLSFLNFLVREFRFLKCFPEGESKFPFCVMLEAFSSDRRLCS